MNKTFSIRTKLLGTFLLIAVFSILSAYFNILNQGRSGDNLLRIVHNSAIIESLLEMKSVAGEVDKEATTFQTVQDSADKKNKLLANLEKLDKWEKEYQRRIDLDNAEDVSFLGRLEEARNNIVDSSLAYLSLKEDGADDAESAAQARVLDAAIVDLRQIIEDAIVRERIEIEIVTSEAVAVSAAAVRENIILSFAAVAIALLLGFLLTRLIARPIQLLRDGAMHISEGDLGQSLSVRTHDELGELAAAFNDMTTKLKTSRTGLEAQVQETEQKAAALGSQVIENNRSKAAILNLLEDIDEEKKRAEETVLLRTKELREEKARLLASINSLSFGFVLSDAQDRILLKNPILEKILDVGTDIQSIHDITRLLQKPDSKIDLDIAASCKRCMELKEPVEFKEVPYGKKFLRIICAPVGEGAETIGYIFIVEDITEAKVMERSRDEFFAVASHELRTPLTAIKGNADMILTMFADKIQDKDVKEMLQDINASSVRLIDVVNDFLEVSRLEQGRIEIKKESFELAEVVGKVVRDMHEMVQQKGLALSYVSPQGLPPVVADKNRVEQVLLNLVGNAIKFSRQGTISIEAVMEGESIKVSVTDTGVGISPQNQSRLFRKFQQAGEDMLARDVSQSTGLGLYISKLIMQAMGGDIGLEKSELGRGSTFYFTVPVAKT